MLIWIKGAGDLASGAAVRLFRSHMQLVMTELPGPTSVRRTVCFSEAVRLGSTEVEGIRGVRAETPAEALQAIRAGFIAVMPDPSGRGDALKANPEGGDMALRPDVLVDAVMAKRNTGTSVSDAPVVIALGPGFTAGQDCHAVIETKRGHTLGRVLYEGSAVPNTGIPGVIGGYGAERVFRAPAEGIFYPVKEIGDLVREGEVLAVVKTEGGEAAVSARISGMVRGMLPEGTPVRSGMKAGDIDPRGASVDYRLVSDKSLSVGGGVLEAVLHLSRCLADQPRKSAEPLEICL